MSDPIQGLIANGLPKGLPEDAVPFAAVNATDITTTTKQTIKAAVGGKRMFITQANATNITAAEVQILALRHGTTDVALLIPSDGSDANPSQVIRFDPPIVIPKGVDLDGIGLIAAVGDCRIAVCGYTGT
jgi:hypothetical protein